MPRTIPQQEIDRIKELAKVKPKLTWYAIAKIIQQESESKSPLHRATVKRYLTK